MPFQAPPPAEPAPPAAEQRVLRQDTTTTIAASLDRPLLIQKPPAAEPVVVRQRLLLRAALTHLALSEGEGRDRGDCRWEIVSYVQRDLCFTSLTGLTGCTASVTDKLAQEASGVFDVDPPPPAGPPSGPPPGPIKTCAFTSAPLVVLLADATARLEDRSAQIFESDYQTHVRPLLTRTGATLKAR